MNIKKSIKILFVLLIFSMFSSMIYTKAITGSIGITGIKLPIAGGFVVATSENKGTISNQHYRNYGVTSDLHYTEEGIVAQTKGLSGNCENSTSNQLLIGYNSSADFDSSNHCTQFTGRYQISLKRASWVLTTATHSGNWYLDDTYYNN